MQASRQMGRWTDVRVVGYLMSEDIRLSAHCEGFRRFMNSVLQLLTTLSEDKEGWVVERVWAGWQAGGLDCRGEYYVLFQKNKLPSHLASYRSRNNVSDA